MNLKMRVRKNYAVFDEKLQSYSKITKRLFFGQFKAAVSFAQSKIGWEKQASLCSRKLSGKNNFFAQCEITTSNSLLPRGIVDCNKLSHFVLSVKNGKFSLKNLKFKNAG
jgi:hypothetical protein